MSVMSELMQPRAAPAPGISETQSYGFIIRNIIFDALVGMPMFNGFFPRKTRQMQIQDNQIPFLAVYMMGEDGAPDGDLNAGSIDLRKTLRLGIAVIIADNDPEVLEQKLDAYFWAICHRLLPDPFITNLLDARQYGHPDIPANPDNIRFEGVARLNRRNSYGTVALNNEMPNAELQCELHLVHREMWPPVITDELRHVHIETVPMRHDGTVPPADEVERVISEIDLFT